MKRILSAFGLLFCSCLSAQAQVSYHAISNDANSGISAAKTYTHALDFGTSAAAVVNGVNFQQVTMSNIDSINGFHYGITTGTRNDHGGNGNHGIQAGNGAINLFTDMIYNGGNTPGGDARILLSGLQRGAVYEQRIYVRPWNPGDNARQANVSFNNGSGATTSILMSEDNPTFNPPGFASNTQAYALAFQHTAASGMLQTTFDQINNNNSWHIYGLTNELISLGNSADYLPIPLFNSGVDATGNVLAPGSTDPHWTVTQSPQNGVPPAAPFAAVVTQNNSAWSANDAVGTPGSSWISVVPNGATNIAPGTYIYETQFDLTGFDPSTALLEMLVQADDTITDVLLNGQSTGLTASPGLSGFDLLTLDTGFVDGINTLAFAVSNSGTNAGGFRVELSGSASAAVPEPATLALWSFAGLFGVAGLVAARRRATTAS